LVEDNECAGTVDVSEAAGRTSKTGGGKKILRR
jgi:hypothetical protein